MSKQTPTSIPAAQAQRQQPEPQQQSAEEAAGPAPSGAPADRLRPGDLQALQGTVGNRAVQRMLGGRDRQPPSDHVAPAYQLGPVWRSAEQPALFRKPPAARAAASEGQIPVAKGGTTGLVQRVLVWKSTGNQLTEAELKGLLEKRPREQAKAASPFIYEVIVDKNGKFRIQKKLSRSERRVIRGEARKRNFAIADERRKRRITGNHHDLDVKLQSVDNIDPYSVEEMTRGEVEFFLDNTEVRVSGEREKIIRYIYGSLIVPIHEKAKWFLRSDGFYEARVPYGDGSVRVVFNEKSAYRIESAVHALYLRFIEEAQPRSGLGRASDEKEGTHRIPSKHEARYAEKKTSLVYDMPENKNPHTVFKSARVDERTIVSEIVHKGPWGKGSRDMGQIAVMGGQSAKNYALDVLLGDLPGRDKEAARNIQGRWEWLHLIASSLGGLNTASNLVAGTYDANTRMIALEHRVALWGRSGYAGDFKPTEATPITITSTATVAPKSHLAERIVVRVLHGDKEIASGDYKASDRVVVTKDQYRAEEKRVEDQITAARPPQAPVAMLASAQATVADLKQPTPPSAPLGQALLPAGTPPSLVLPSGSSSSALAPALPSRMPPMGAISGLALPSSGPLTGAFGKPKPGSGTDAQPFAFNFDTSPDSDGKDSGAFPSGFGGSSIGLGSGDWLSAFDDSGLDEKSLPPTVGTSHGVFGNGYGASSSSGSGSGSLSAFHYRGMGGPSFGLGPVVPDRKHSGPLLFSPASSSPQPAIVPKTSGAASMPMPAPFPSNLPLLMTGSGAGSMTPTPSPAPAPQLLAQSGMLLHPGMPSVSRVAPTQGQASAGGTMPASPPALSAASGPTGSPDSDVTMDK